MRINKYYEGGPRIVRPFRNLGFGSIDAGATPLHLRQEVGGL